MLSCRYSADKYPVYAMRGAPASFPVQPRDRDLQRYIEFSEGVSRVGDKYIADNFPNKPFVGIHLRNGMDWVRDVNVFCVLVARQFDESINGGT